MLDLDDIFGSEGPLRRALPDFKVRRQQLRMAERVAEALAGRGLLAVEAGTGTGKTFAYLVPALLSGARVLISTGTRTLQDQLFSKDLPLVARAIGRPARIALLKGRANYLCRYRLGRAGNGAEQLALDDSFASEPPANEKLLMRIRRWSQTTRSGDLAEVRGLSDANPIWPHVTSSRENCLGTKCPEVSRCHVVQARRAALDADIVIVNHHLLLADLALKEDGFGDILGTADAVILDEAHQIADLATQFFGAHVGSRRIESLLQDVRVELSRFAPSAHEAEEGVAAALAGSVHAVEDSLQQLRGCMPARVGRVAWAELHTQPDNAVSDLAGALGMLQIRLESLGEDSSFAAFTERLGELSAGLERIAAVDAMEGARAVEVTARGFSLSLMPYDISSRFHALVHSRHCAWVFTSATLSVGEDFSHFTHRLGLQDAPTLKIDSPFDYERQSLLFLPAGMPDPTSPGYTAAVMSRALEMIDASRGGAFVLFTSHRALSQGAAWLRERWKSAVPPYSLYVQGEAPRERLLKEFREDGNAVLLGTASFWEGVDVKGEALRLVIIDKLPFASPEDPLVRARIEHLQATGANAFRDYQLPEAALALKQGVGRLIRSEEDYGAVVICDPRVVGRSYGRVLLSALPPMTATRDVDEALRFLRRHAPVGAITPNDAAPTAAADS
ncbi:MAG TPA: ATP-dependent DNA helicase [Steroidobacteraceae bacterium]|nr:ATP-dependent DNA helicase [Steroidobacteraceae bacterium]